MSDFNWPEFDYRQHEKQLTKPGKYRFHVTAAQVDSRRKHEGIEVLALQIRLENGQMAFPRVIFRHPKEVVQKIGQRELAKLVKHLLGGKVSCPQDFIGRRGAVEIVHAPGKDGTVYERFKYLASAEAVKLNKPAPLPKVQPTPNPLEDLMDANGLPKASKSCKANKTKSQGQEEPLETEDEEDAPLLPKKRKVEEEEDDAPPPPKKRKAASEEDEDLEPDETDFPSRSAVKRTPKAKPKCRPEADHTDDGEE